MWLMYITWDWCSIHLACKDQHGLREKDIDHRDSQNYDAVLHITSQCVIMLLLQIPEAKDTSAFLNVVQCVIDSYLDRTLDCLMRIEKACFAVVFFREVLVSVVVAW